jgi:hypothetical protein
MKIFFLTVMALFFLASCAGFSEEAERRLNELKDKTNSLDSLLNKEFDKILTLDSIIDEESKKVRELDSLILESTSKFDSIRNEKTRKLERLFN